MTRIIGVTVVLGLAVGGATAHADKTFNAGTGATWDCAKDADVTINSSNGTYTFKGACEDINVNGSGLAIVVESVEDITINGSKNRVDLGAIEDVSVNGNDNTITWKRALKPSKPPKLSTRGAGNTLEGGGSKTTDTLSTGTATAVFDCTKQKTVSIMKGKGTYRVTGTCTKVAISGGHNAVEIEATKNLAITGSSNTVSVDKADKIAAMGSNNTVTYAGGLTVATPKVATMGKRNTVTKGGAATATTTVTATTTTTTATPPGTIDCGKQATHTIAANDGNYTFVGACGLITVNGNDNNLTVASAKAIYVAGNHNNLSITAVDRLAIPGNDNVARYQRGMAGRAKPKLSVPGNDNRVQQVK